MLMQQVYVSFSPPTPLVPAAHFSVDHQIVATGADSVFTDLSTRTPTSWHWEKNDGSGWVDFAGTPTAQNPTETLADGSWSIRLTATNAAGDGVDTKTNYVVVAPAPTISSAAISATGVVLAIDFDRNVTGHVGFTLNASGGVVNATYSSGDGTTSLNFTLNRTILETETLTLDYAPGNAVSALGVPLASVSAGAVTNGSQIPTASFTTDVTSGSAPLAVAFTDTSTQSPSSWLWEKNDGSGWTNFGTSFNSQNPTETFSAGTWSIRLTVSNSFGTSVPDVQTDLITAS